MKEKAVDQFSDNWRLSAIREINGIDYYREVLK